MAGRYRDPRRSDDFGYLSVPQSNRGYHSDDEVRQKKRIVVVEPIEHPVSKARMPSPPPRMKRAHVAPYSSRVPSPPTFRTDHRRFSSQDVRPSRAVSPPPPAPYAPTRDGSYPLSPEGKLPLHAQLSPLSNQQTDEDKRKEMEEAWRRERMSMPQRPDSGVSFPKVTHPQEQRSWHKRSGSAGRSVATSPSLATSGKSLPSSTSGTLGDKTYRYSTLGESEIRLIRLLPARMFRIKCEVFHAPTTNPPKYIAISYAWGDAGDTRRLELEGTEISVSASLYGALQALRKKNDIATVWVDALCIDQHNRGERTQQVQMMTKIYSRAESVAVWLGPEADRSSDSAEFLLRMTQHSGSPDKITKLLSSERNKNDIAATVSLFERDYWKRLWVVQEVFNARSVTVYCGSSKLPWDVYREASNVFQRHKGDLDNYFPGNSQGRTYARASQNHFTYAQILTYQGPGSLPDVRALRHYEEESLLEVMRVCRRKFSSDPKDKVFGILGLLTEDVRKDFPVDYSLSVKEIYTDVVDFLISTTGRFDVICEAIHYPPHMNTANLPSWAPDWSHIPDTVALGAMDFEPPFSASQRKEIKFSWKDDRRNKIEITALEIDTIRTHGIAVGTLCTLADYLMAFIHWRALLLATYKADDLEAQDLFCRALCLNQVPRKWANSFDWVTACFHVFASLIRERLPHLPLDQELEKYIDAKTDIKPDARRRFLQEHFGSRMMGRCFYITEGDRIGIGSGFMAVGDTVVVPLGCSTPVVLRPEERRSECRYVGDAYLHGYMYGRAIDQWRNGDRKASKFVLH